MKTVQVWRSEIKTERMQDRAQDRFSRFMGLEIQQWECEFQPAGDIAALRRKCGNLAPGRYYAVRVMSLRNGAPISRAAAAHVRYFPDPEKRDAYIGRRIRAFWKKVRAA